MMTCSLREGLALAKVLPGTDTIKFAPGLGGGDLSLTAGQLNIDSSVVIDGEDAVTIHAAANSRIFYIYDGSQTSAPIDVTLRGMTLAGGSVLGSEVGGAIFNSTENIFLESVQLRNNSAENVGGAIYSFKGSLTLNDVTV